MRFLHTSDWHLGKTLCNANLLEDQAHALDQAFAMAKEAKPKAFVIAGDIYDRAVPPKEAVALLNDFLGRVVGELKVPVLMIAGNHDSPERLGFGFPGTPGAPYGGPPGGRAPAGGHRGGSFPPDALRRPGLRPLRFPG